MRGKRTLDTIEGNDGNIYTSDPYLKTFEEALAYLDDETWLIISVNDTERMFEEVVSKTGIGIVFNNNKTLAIFARSLGFVGECCTVMDLPGFIGRGYKVVMRADN